MDRCAVFALKKMGFQEPERGVTINASESLNEVLKVALQRKVNYILVFLNDLSHDGDSKHFYRKYQSTS